MPTVATQGVPQVVLDLLPADVVNVLQSLPIEETVRLEEIRLRLHRPLQLVGGQTQSKLLVTESHLRHIMATVTGSSVYAVEQELRRGYITVQGGHRVGIAGRAVLDDEGHIKTLRDIGSFNIRIARQIQSHARRLGSILINDARELLPTLVVGPPLAGKTTLLRDLAKMLGNGDFHSHLEPLRVSIVDERSEIAGCFKGAPQFDVGWATDVLDACPKVEGMYLMLRAMAPQVLMTDEIGSKEDVEAIMDVARAGVTFVGSVHAHSMDELAMRPALKPLLSGQTIMRFILLSRRHGPGTFEGVYDQQFHEVARSWR